MSTNSLLAILRSKIRGDKLVLPTLPEIAIRVRKAADDPDTDLKTMAQVISQDPSLSARIIKIANTGARNRNKVSNLQQAVTRIGLFQIKNVATALAMEQLFVSRNPEVRKRLDDIWRQTVLVTANAVAIIKPYVKRNRKSTASEDTMTLLGMVHNIGCLPVLTAAEERQEIFGHPKFIDEAFDEIGPEIGSIIVRSWEFSDEIIQAVANWQQTTRDVCYGDILKLAYAVSIPGSFETSATIKECLEKGIIADDKFQDAEFDETVASIRAAFE